MTQPDRLQEAVLSDWRMDDPLWHRYIGGMVVELDGFLAERPSENHLHQVGELGLGPEGTIPALLPGLGEAHMAFADAEHTGSSLDTVRSLVLQMLESVPAGSVKLRVYNGYLAEHTDAFADFAKGLGSTLFEQIPPNGLNAFLNDIESRNLDLANRKTTVGSPTDPWEIAVIMEDDSLDEKTQRQLDKLVAAGPHHGSIVTVGVNVEANDNLRVDTWPFPVKYDEPKDDILARCQKIAHEAGRPLESPDLGSIVDAEKWTRTAHHGIEAAIGVGEDGQPFKVSFDDKTPHGLMLGPTGKGKSNTLEVAIASLARGYSPNELKLYLLDHKLGVEFARYAVEEYLPHAEVVGTSVNRDPELAVAVLTKMKEEIERRADLFRDHGVREYAQMREADPEMKLERVLAIIDEVQLPLKSHKGTEMAKLLDYIASQGRAFGVHLLLAAQKVDDIPALQSVNLWQNFAMRIALQQGTVMNAENTIAAGLPDYHVLVNTQHGKTDQDAKKKANHVVWVANVAGDEVYQQELYRDRGPDAKPPRVFDGAVEPELEQARSFQRLKPARNPKLLLGEAMSVEDRSASFVLSRDPGKNLAVIGASGMRRREANDILRSAVLSYGKQRQPDETEIALVVLDSQSEDAASQTASELREQGHDVKIRWPEDAPAFLSEVHTNLDLETERPHVLVVYGADSSGARMKPPLKLKHAIEIGDRELRTGDDREVMAGIDTIMVGADGGFIKSPYNGKVKVRDGKIIIEESTLSGRAHLREIMKNGPENGTFVLASFSTVGLLQEALDDRGLPVGPDVIGAYVALGISQDGLRSLTPDNAAYGSNSGHERERRGVFYDRFSGRQPEIISMYGSPRNASADDDN